MKFCTITPTRGDRPYLLEFCKIQIESFTNVPTQMYLIDFHPETERCDLVARVRKAYSMAVLQGMEWAIMIEDDDYYPADYIKKMLPYMNDRYDFIGQDYSIYYNLRNQTWKRFEHKRRSSLFITAFRIEAMKDFNWRVIPPHTPFLDQPLWEHAERKRSAFIDTGAIGIKHAMGMTGGKGHKMVFENKDPDLRWLKENTDPEAFEFYQSLIPKLQPI